MNPEADLLKLDFGHQIVTQTQKMTELDKLGKKRAEPFQNTPDPFDPILKITR